MLRDVESSIPPAVLTFVDVRSRRRLAGYFAWSIWKKRRGKAHEIGISPRLIGNPKELLEVMLHEAAHAVLHELGENGGMGAGGYYHLKSFRDQCIAFGLKCEFLNTRYGFTLTSWPANRVPERYRPVVDHLRQELPSGTGRQLTIPRKARPLPMTGHTMLTCGCVGGTRSVYVKKSVLEAGGVLCAICKMEFRSLK